MQRLISHSTKRVHATLDITGSKSETNRLLLLQALFPQLVIENASNSDDSVAMKKALHSEDRVKDIHHAGTAMRFLTAYFAASTSKEVELTGSARMQERPIALLVDALRALGADIEYAKQTGYPPLIIQGKSLKGGKVSLPANVSSQYISALLLSAPCFEQGLQLTLEGAITSLPYIKMTLALLERIGLTASFDGQTITVPPQYQVAPQHQIVESDWSSASYWFSIAALSQTAEIRLNSYYNESLQGDAVLMKIFWQLGVESSIEGHQLILKKIPDFQLPSTLTLDLIEAPDIAQTIAVACYGLGVECRLHGLHTLKIKETDRLIALENELGKLGATIEVDENSLWLSGKQNFQANQSIDTYNDHRMAMAFAPLALQIPLTINDAEVVSKSYPGFWEDLQKSDFQVLEK